MKKPIACTLGIADLAVQRQGWQRLREEARVERRELPNGLQLVFAGGHDVAERLEQLVAVERECCAFADWTVTAGAGKTTLEITAEADAVPVLHGMFA